METETPFNPQQLIQILGYDLYEQQDTVEVLERLLNIIPDEQKSKFVIKQINNKNCNQVLQNILILSVINNKNVEQALQNLQKEFDVKYVFSDTILIQIARHQFDVNTFSMIKLNDDFKYSFVLSPNKKLTDKLISCRQDQKQYILTLVVVHQGTGVGGHYYVYKLNLQKQHHYQSIRQLKKQQWYKISDAKVSKVSQKEVFSKRNGQESAALLIYENSEKFLNQHTIRSSLVSVDHERIQKAKITLKKIQSMSKNIQQVQVYQNQDIIDNKGIQLQFNQGYTIELDKETLISDFITQQQTSLQQVCVINKKYSLRELNHFDKYITIEDLFSQQNIIKYKLFISKYQQRVFVSVLQIQNDNQQNILSLEDYIVQLGEVELNQDVQNNILTILQQNLQNNDYTGQQLQYYIYNAGSIEKITNQQQITNNCQIIVQVNINENSTDSQQYKSDYMQITQFSPRLQRHIHTVPELFHELQKRIKITFKIMPDKMMLAHKQSIRLTYLTFGGYDLQLYPQIMRRYKKQLQEYKQVSDITLSVRYTDTLQSLMQQVLQQINDMVCFQFSDNSQVKYKEVISILQYTNININEVTYKLGQEQNGVVFMSNIQCNGKELYVNEPLQVLSHIKKESGEEKSIGQYIKLVNNDALDKNLFETQVDDDCPKFNSQKINTWVFDDDEQSIITVENKEVDVKHKDDEYTVYYRIPLLNYKLLQHANVLRIVLVHSMQPLIDTHVIISRNINIASSSEIYENIKPYLDYAAQFFYDVQQTKIKFQLSLQSINSEKLIIINENKLISELRGTPMSQNWFFRCDFLDESFDSDNLDYVLLKNNDKYVGYPLIYDKQKYTNEDQLQRFIDKSIIYNNQIYGLLKRINMELMTHSNHKFRNYFIHAKHEDFKQLSQLQLDEKLQKYYIACNQYTQIFKDNDQVKLHYQIGSKELNEFLL